MSTCACGHWEADHIGKTGPCAARIVIHRPIGFFWTTRDATCPCDGFHVRCACGHLPKDHAEYEPGKWLCVGGDPDYPRTCEKHCPCERAQA